VPGPATRNGVRCGGWPVDSLVQYHCAVLTWRLACRLALLAQQGLRPTTVGGHKAVDDAIRAQFGASLRAFGGLRRWRNELIYPDYPTGKASAGEAAEALQTASEIIDAAAQLLPNLGSFCTASKTPIRAESARLSNSCGRVYFRDPLRERVKVAPARCCAVE
jgi:hypothetical protein